MQKRRKIHNLHILLNKSDMKDFIYYAPTEVVFGKSSEEQVASLVKKYGGHKELVHYGAGII